MVLSVFLFLAGLVLLYLGGEGLVRSAATLGIRFGMTPLVAGLTLVAFSTSAPELAVSIDAALTGVPGIAVGNVIGSNICNLALILGVTALIKPPALRHQLVRRDVVVVLLATWLVPAMLLADDTLSRLEGALLTAAIVGYVAMAVLQPGNSREFEKAAEAHADDLFGRTIFANTLVGLVSIGLLVYGSQLFVASATDIAMTLGVPSAVVGLSAAALGTSLPELTASIIAARHNQAEMAAGNLIGSNIFNLLLVLGATALVRPLEPGGVTVLDIGVMVATTLLAIAVMVGRPRVERGYGAVLTGTYVVYMGWLYVQGPG